MCGLFRCCVSCRFRGAENEPTAAASAEWTKNNPAPQTQPGDEDEVRTSVASRSVPSRLFRQADIDNMEMDEEEMQGSGADDEDEFAEELAGGYNEEELEDAHHDHAHAAETTEQPAAPKKDEL